MHCVVIELVFGWLLISSGYENWLNAVTITVMLCIHHRVSKNCASVTFLNNSVKHWPTLIIFGMQHRKEMWRKRL